MAVRATHGMMLEPTSVTARSGEVTVVAGPPGSGHVALALVLAGRLVPTTGRVRLDGESRPDRIPEVVAVVDCPGVSEPEEAVPLGTAVGEELAYAHASNTPRAITRYLHSRGVSHLAQTRVAEVPGDIRISLFAELAAIRPGVEGLVLVCPDRYGATARHCSDVADSLAEAGYAVVLQLMGNTAMGLDVETARMGVA
ncbi:hypothetical protein FE697_018760 [Mumia zhuanghuii]|uniref:ATP-binding cassette domain-containing protein n=2 Tax=Mumia TaxID=1546255 RepID=A0ABW1QLY2_9ACTN|nr:MULTISPECIES: ATP-binding cassette domain-containing protein [Mumia]KAA1419937.1 hypothetical protein FE697_018760 [Mumia zhuanghuii]